MDFRLREIAGKPAGQYFIVSDNSGTTDIVQTSNLRVVPINSRKGVVNTFVIIQRGDQSALETLFGKSTRKMEKQGNYSLRVASEMLQTSSIAVINLRAFDDELDTIQVCGMSPNNFEIEEIATIPYKDVFNQNGFWSPKAKQIPDHLTTEQLLNFANIGTGKRSFFVTVATDVTSLTNQGEETLAESTLEIEEYPALRADMLVKETFVDVWMFDNDFSDPSLNTFYGQLFDNQGMISSTNLEKLSQIKASGFNRKVTGSVIPYLKNNSDESISIDTIMNQVYAETGVLCFINDEVLEDERENIIDTTLRNYFDGNAELVNDGILMSYRIQPDTSKTIDNETMTSIDLEKLTVPTLFENVFPNEDGTVLGWFEHGIRQGALVSFPDGTYNKVSRLELTEKYDIPKTTSTINAFGSVNSDTELVNVYVFDKTSTHKLYKKLESEDETQWRFVRDFVETISFEKPTENTQYYVKLVQPATSKIGDSVSKILLYEATTGYINTTQDLAPQPAETFYSAQTVKYHFETPLQNTSTETFVFIPQITAMETKLLPTILDGYVPRDEQFTNGTASRQSEILDVLNSDSIFKGLKQADGIRYFVDGFKTFVEANYKYQFNLLCDELDKCNKFVRAFVNEPFIEDLEKSTNPMFKPNPSSPIALDRYLAKGGNDEFSTMFLNKPTTGAEYVFYFGSGNVDEPNVYPNAGLISSAFIAKTLPWDIVANASGYIDGISGLELNPDDDERLAMEKFGWNPIVKRNSLFTIFGNATGLAVTNPTSSLAQIHNSELLAYIKESLLNMSMDESFKKGTYDDYIRLETAVTSFMEGLVQQGAIEPNPVVICNFSNNTTEIQKAKIKLVNIEFTCINGLDKVVFALDLN